jgi:hypothetical protein
VTTDNPVKMHLRDRELALGARYCDPSAVLVAQDELRIMAREHSFRDCPVARGEAGKLKS